MPLDTVRLELKDGQWIDVIAKDDLTGTDDEQMLEYASRGLTTDGKNYDLNSAKYVTSVIAHRVKAWHLNGAGPFPGVGSKIGDKRQAARDLKNRTRQAIMDAIGTHDEAAEKEAQGDQAKNSDAAAETV